MKKLLTVLLSFCLFVACFTSTATAQQYKSKTIMDFNEVTLEGDIRKPNIIIFTPRVEKTFANIIEHRKSFEKEMLSSTNSLK